MVRWSLDVRRHGEMAEERPSMDDVSSRHRTRSMSAPVASLIAAIVALSVLVAAGPTVVGLAKALPTIVLAVGLAAALLRLVWFVTARSSS